MYCVDQIWRRCYAPDGPHCIPRMWVSPGSSSSRKKNSSLTLLQEECYEGEVQPYRKMKLCRDPTLSI